MAIAPTRRILPGKPESVGHAREWLAVTYGEALGDRDGVLYNVSLMVSELVTNALRYTRSADTQVELVGDLDAGTFTVNVIDNGSEFHYPELPDPDYGSAETGRGLCIVNELADEWGVIDLPGGRRAVWFSVKL